MENNKIKVGKLFKSEKFSKYLIICGAVGILLLFFSEMPIKSKKPPKADNSDVEYVRDLEEKLKNMISDLEGAGETKIMITLENGVEYKYAFQERKSQDISEDIQNEDNKSLQKRDSSENNYIIIDGEKGREALVERKIQPKIRGVAVLCRGGDSAAVKNEVIQLVTTVLDIPSTKVSVSKLKYDK